MKSRPGTQALVLALCATFVLTQEVGNIIDVAEAKGFSTLVELLKHAKLVDAITGEGPLTVFAPTNKAFDVIGPETLNALKNNTSLLKAVLTYHVVPDEVYSSNLTNGDVITSLEGTRLWINTFPYGLLPVMTVNGAQLLPADVKASNGVIHAIDRVLILPQGDVTDVLAADPRFSKLVTAVMDAGLLDTLKSEGPFTVFAPTNAAFNLLPDGALDSLRQDPAALSDVLLRHVVGMAVCYRAFPDTVTTVNNQTLTIVMNIANAEMSVSSDQGKATLSDLDIIATNGVIHVIDAVI